MVPSDLVWQISQNILDEKQRHPRNSVKRSVIACQAPETFLFSIFPWEGGELSLQQSL